MSDFAASGFEAPEQLIGIHFDHFIEIHHRPVITGEDFRNLDERHHCAVHGHNDRKRGRANIQILTKIPTLLALFQAFAEKTECYGTRESSSSVFGSVLVSRPVSQSSAGAKPAR